MLTIAGQRESAITIDIADTFFEYSISYGWFDSSGKIFPRFSALIREVVLSKSRFAMRNGQRPFEDPCVSGCFWRAFCRFLETAFLQRKLTVSLCALWDTRIPVDRLGSLVCIHLGFRVACSLSGSFGIARIELISVAAILSDRIVHDRRGSLQIWHAVCVLSLTIAPKLERLAAIVSDHERLGNQA